MPSDTSEHALESIIVQSLLSNGYVAGAPQDYERNYMVDLEQLATFVEATQPEVAEALALRGDDSPVRRRFLARLQGEVAKRGVVDVLRRGVKHGPHHVDLFYGTPTEGNTAAQERYSLNRFSVTRQLRYSNNETARSLDVALFINGLPVITMELKNSLTKQTVADAIEQYRRDRNPNPNEKLFDLGRCMAHFAADDTEVYFCTHLKGKASWFLPFNKGWNQGAGNPPNPNGLKTAYLWEEILRPNSLTDILENYAGVFEQEEGPREGSKPKSVKKAIFPRLHQLAAVRELLADVAKRGVGQRYLIQHSAGSGKSNSIAWLAHQLVDLERGGTALFDSVVVVTDRRVLDKQISDTICQFAQVRATVGHAQRAGDLRKFLQQGKKIIITTVQKFPFILDEINLESGKRFAILIDEAHSSQGGKAAAAMNQAMAGEEVEEEQDQQDFINDALQQRMKARKMLDNASYFAFTATPKNRTLETFGRAIAGADGKVAHEPFHIYSMKQATQEGFIMDVLKNYTPVHSYYRLSRRVEDDPVFDSKRAQKKLRNYVEGHEHAIRTKAEIMVDHFTSQVLAQRKVGGEARAMIVTSSIQRAIDYYFAIQSYLESIKSPYKAIVAFSGEPEYAGKKVTEAELNGFPSKEIAAKVRTHPYRFLICANKFQTGYDEPLLHTMYVDKPLSGIQAVGLVQF